MRMGNIVVLAAAVFSLVTVLVWIGLLVWGAVEDGRVQRRHDRDRR